MAATSKQLGLGPMKLQTLEGASVPLPRMESGDLHSMESPGDTVRRALERAGISLKDAALTMGVDGSQFSKQLAGKEHLSVQRLALLPPMFWAEYLLLLCRKHGLPLQTPEKHTALRAVLSALNQAIVALE